MLLMIKMKFIPLTIKLPEDVSKFETELMQEIVSFFVSHGYHKGLIRDKSTSYEGYKDGSYAVYVFKINENTNVPKKELSLDEVNDFLKDKSLEYRLELK